MHSLSRSLARPLAALARFPSGQRQRFDARTTTNTHSHMETHANMYTTELKHGRVRIRVISELNAHRENQQQTCDVAASHWIRVRARRPVRERPARSVVLRSGQRYIL